MILVIRLNIFIPINYTCHIITLHNLILKTYAISSQNENICIYVPFNISADHNKQTPKIVYLIFLLFISYLPEENNPWHQSRYQGMLIISLASSSEHLTEDDLCHNIVWNDDKKMSKMLMEI